MTGRGIRMALATAILSLGCNNAQPEHVTHDMPSSSEQSAVAAGMERAAPTSAGSAPADSTSMAKPGDVRSPPSQRSATPIAESRVLLSPYGDWDMQDTVADSLARIGEPAVPSLVRMLRHPQAKRRVQAAEILARIGPQAKEGVPGLVEALADPDPDVRKAVARALGQIGPAAADAVGPLLRVLEESSATGQPSAATLP